MITRRTMAQWLGSEETFSGTLHSRHRHPLAPRLPVASKEETAAFWYTPEAHHREAAALPAELPTALDATLPQSLLFPDVVGILSDGDKAVIGQFFTQIAEQWHTADSAAMTHEELKGILDAKTRLRPSYFTEYALILGVYRILAVEHGADQATELLLNTPPGEPGTVAWHIRTYFLAECLRLHIAKGAFRSFGYINYPGWAGGPFDDPEHLPYRRIPEEPVPP